MTAEQSSEDNDGDQVRATIGLAGGCAVRAGIRGLSEGFIDFEALVAAAGSRHCPDRHPSRDWIHRLGGWPTIGVRAGRRRPG
jgi:hypothetical protein